MPIEVRRSSLAPHVDEDAYLVVVSSTKKLANGDRANKVVEYQVKRTPAWTQERQDAGLKFTYQMSYPLSRSRRKFAILAEYGVMWFRIKNAICDFDALEQASTNSDTSATAPAKI